MKITNKKLSNDDFFAERKEVLNHGPTGKNIDLDEAGAYQKTIPDSKRFGTKLQKATAEGITLVQPRAGVALYEKHIELLQYLENEGGADLLPSTIDSYTRLNRYHEAEVGIEKSIETGRSMLNGFPVVNYGQEICRKVTSVMKSPVQEIGRAHV